MGRATRIQLVAVVLVSRLSTLDSWLTQRRYGRRKVHRKCHLRVPRNVSRMRVMFMQTRLPKVIHRSRELPENSCA
jgi:hypothetical protein